MINDELKRVGVVGVDEKAKLLRFGPALEIRFGDGCDFLEITVQRLPIGPTTSTFTSQSAAFPYGSFTPAGSRGEAYVFLPES